MLCVLGSIRVLSGEHELDLGAPAQRRVLAALALAVGRPVSVDRLIDISWPETPPASARNLIQGYISGLRRVLALDRIAGTAIATVERTPGGYRLVVDHDQIDAGRFEGLLERAGRSTAAPAESLALLDEALALWKGDALADFAEEPFARREAARLEELRLVAMERRFAARLDLGDHEAVLAELQAFAATHPERERTIAMVVTTLYRAGRQTEALETLASTSARLREELGLELTPELRALELRVLQHDPSLAEPPPAPEMRLPLPASSLVGRRSEIAEVTQALQRARLVTLVGPGGVGKTRVATAAASAADPTRFEGVWFVDLTPVRSGAGVLRTVADALGVREASGSSPMDAVAATLRSRPVLLVVDNCEHVIDDVVPTVAELLQRCPAARVLATSREPLHLQGEVLRAIAPLALVAPTDGGASDAVQLFVERAAAAQPGFALDPARTELAAAICNRLDGLPLAIELAAPMVRSLSLSQISDMLKRRISGLPLGPRDAADRHRSLEATLGWSCALLTEPQRCAFESLAVFVGAFDLDAVEKLLSTDTADGNGREHLDRLVATSLASVVDPNADPLRFRLLAVTREFAEARLKARGDDAVWRTRHASVFADRAEQAARGLRTADAARQLDAIAADLEDIRAALQWSLQQAGDRTVGQRLAASLAWFWFIRGPLGEASDWLTAATSFPVDDPALRRRLLHAASLTAMARADLTRAHELAEQHRAEAALAADPADEAEATETLGLLAWIRSDYDEARRLLRQAVETSEVAGATWSAIGQRTSLGRVALDIGDREEARAELERALTSARAHGEPFNVAVALEFLAQLALRDGDLTTAGALVDASVEHYRSLGYEEGIASSLQTSAAVARQRGDLADALRRYRESVERCLRVGTTGGIPSALEGLASIAFAEGSPDRSLQLLAAAGALRARLGVPAPASLVAEHDELVASLRRSLGDSFDASWAASEQIPLETLLTMAASFAR